MNARQEGKTPRWGRVLAWTLGGLGVAGAITAVATYAYLEKDLPNITSLSDYDPPQTTKLYSDDGHLVAELAEERRVVVDYDAIPKHVVHAFLSAEDARFFEHEGLDYFGIFRAALKNLRPGAHLQGASTITQQTVKTLVLGPERSYWRKLREAILSRQLETMLTKKEILHLYLNQIYFGAGAYGVEEASKTYFGKSVRDVTVGEAALLAAIPKNPSRYTIFHAPEAAKERQLYVLAEMLENKWIDTEIHDEAAKAEIPEPPARPPYLDKAPHFVDYVRRILNDQLGEETLLRGGYTVYLAMNAEMQVAAQRALRTGLEEVGARHGYPGARARIEVDKLGPYLERLRAWFAEAVEDRRLLYPKARAEAVAWDLARVSKDHLGSPESLLSRVDIAELTEDLRIDGIVEKLDPVGGKIIVAIGDRSAEIEFSSLEWARRFSPTSWTPPPKKPGDVVHRGDLVTIRLGKIAEQGPIPADLVSIPKVEGALVAMDQHSRYVRALVGGYTVEAGGLIRATQSRRQPGSSFKPIVYTAGIATEAITPASICADTPITIRDEWTGEAWRPENYEDGRFDGNITYRTALTKSKNTCSVKLIEKMGPEVVIEKARQLGIESELPKNLTLALGTGGVTPLELTNAYSTISSGGFLGQPIFIRKLVDRRGKVLEENDSKLEQAIDPAVAYVVTQMMTSVIENGTGQRAKVLDRTLAGKTGTTNRSRDVWFGGFSPELTAVVWVGFDNNDSMGGITGSSGALPIWIRFMGLALSGVPAREFEAPPEVVVVSVDPTTGSPMEGEGCIEEVFVAGTEPSPAVDPLPSIFTEDEGMAPF